MARTRIRRTKGDILEPIQATLKDTDGNVVNLVGDTFTFHMVLAADDSVKVNNQAATLDSGAAGTVSYTFVAADVDTAGIYFAWFIRTNTNIEHYPGDGKEFMVEIVESY